MKSSLATYLLTLWAVLTLNFLLPRLLPGDPLAALFDPEAAEYIFNESVQLELAAYYGLDRPLLQQYGDYLAGIITGDIGRSIYLNRPVIELIGSHLPWTLFLVLTSLSLASLAGVWLGAQAAWQAHTGIDRLLVTASTVISNIPVYVTGMALLVVFGARLKWLPLAGGRTPFARYESWPDVAGDIGLHLLLPALALGLALTGANFLLARNSIVGLLGEDFMRVARAKGLSPARLKWGHALRNALLPCIAHLAAQAGIAVTGALFIETVFNYPGIGRLILQAVGVRDYPLIQGIFVAVSIVVLSANLLADWLNARLDPRIGAP